jgi:hypothetical protein
MTENSDKTYERGATLHSACLCCERAADEIERLAARVQHLEERLEIASAWQCTADDPELKRIEIPPEERDSFPDGITCRDATIKLLEEQNERQAANIRVLKRALEPFANIPSVPLSPEGGLEMARHFWAVIGTPDRSHFTQTDLVRARAALQRDDVKENSMDEKTLTVSMSERTWDEMQTEHEAAKAEIRASALDEAIKIADDKLREINARGTWDDKDRHTNDGAAAAAQEIGNALRALKKGECDAG